jgi:Ni/Co efflux regulator RcnB
MKKTLLAATAALLFAGAFSATAAAQSGYYDDGRGDRYSADQYDDRYDRDDRDDRYEDRDGRYDDRRYDDRRYDDRHYDGRRDGRYGRDGRRAGRDRDCDGIPSRYDRYERNVRDRDCDGVHNRFDRRDGRRHTARMRYDAGRYMAPRGYRYSQWNVGSRLPMGYYGSPYYVDYNRYGLNAPISGYRWNRVGNDVYLVDPRSGLIAEVVYSLFR